MVAGLVIVAVVPALEVLIQRCVELLRPTHQRHQPRNIVEHGIRVDPLIALGPAILRARPGAVGVSSLHEPARRVVEITVVARATDEEPEILVPAERLGDLRDRKIIISILERLRGRLGGLVDRNIPELFVIREAGTRLIGDPRLAVVPVTCGITLGRRHGVLVGGVVRQVVIEAMKALVDGLGHDCIRVRGDHDVGVGGVRPLRHPAALLVVLQQRPHHVVDALGSEDRQQGVLGAECIPERIGRVGDSVVHPVVESAVVAAVLREQLGVQQCMVEPRIQDAALVVGGALERHHGEFFVPDALQLRAHGVEIP